MCGKVRFNFTMRTSAPLQLETSGSDAVELKSERFAFKMFRGY